MREVERGYGNKGRHITDIIVKTQLVSHSWNNRSVCWFVVVCMFVCVCVYVFVCGLNLLWLRVFVCVCVRVGSCVVPLVNLTIQLC